jgi:hypothetical protein
MRRMHEEAPRSQAFRTKKAEVQRAPEQAEPELLRLQRSSGNGAVALMVQRDRAASTDAPGAKHKKKAPPKKAEHKLVSGRILKYEIKNEKTYITIGLGTDQGVKKGMQGRLLRASGTQIITFEVDSVNGSTHAYVETNPDGVKEAEKAEIDLGTAPESQEGKEF